MKKKSILVIIGIILVIIISAIIILLTTNKPSNEVPKTNNENKVINSQVKVTGKLAQYLTALTENYYIKYSGNFKDNNGDKVNAIVEYTKDGQSFGLRIDELEVQMICDGKNLYSISNRYKIIVQMAKESFDIGTYNLISDMGQIYVTSYTEKINNKKYDVEEYSYNGKPIKYYFKEEEIKLIKYDNEDISVIRLERKTNNSLLVKPKDYSYAIT